MNVDCTNIYNIQKLYNLLMQNYFKSPDECTDLIILLVSDEELVVASAARLLVEEGRTPKESQQRMKPGCSCEVSAPCGGGIEIQGQYHLCCVTGSNALFVLVNVAIVVLLSSIFRSFLLESSEASVEAAASTN
jgi:hypothetical protein